MGSSYQYYTPWIASGFTNTITVKRLGVYIRSATFQPLEYINIGMYTDNAGSPGIKLGETSLIQGDGIAGWHSKTVQVPFNITRGNKYWYAIGSVGDYSLDRDDNADCSSNQPMEKSKYITVLSGLTLPNVPWKVMSSASKWGFFQIGI